MKIGIDARCLEWQKGGVARYVSQMLRLWPQMSSQHEFILYFQNNIPQEDYLDHPSFVKKICSGPSFLRKRRILTEQILLPRIIAEDRVDVFFATWYSAPLLLKGIKSVVGTWDISYSTHPQHYSLMNRFSLAFFSKGSAVKANGVVTCSDYDAKQIETFYKIPQHKICTLYLSADEKFTHHKDEKTFLSIKNKYKIKDKYLLSMGVIYNRRCVDTLIEAFKSIEAQFPEVQLLLVGKNATNPPLDLRTLLKPLVESHRAIYLEWIPEDELQEFYHWASFYICTSTVDGETIMLKEAMQCGTPVITSTLLEGTIGGIGHIIKDLTNIAETANVLAEALKMPEDERKAMIQRGLDWVKQFSWEKVAQKSLQFLESL